MEGSQYNSKSSLDALWRRPYPSPEPTTLPEAATGRPDAVKASTSELVPSSEKSGRTEKSRPSRIAAILSPLLQTIFSIAVISTSCLVFVYLNSAAPTVKPIDKVQIRTAVEVVSTEPFAKRLDLETTGVALSAKQLNVTTEISGKVIQLSENCRIGRSLKQGEIIAKLDPTEYEIEVRRLQGVLEQSRASLRETETEISSFDRKLTLARQELQLRENEYRRVEQLQHGNAISKSELNTAALTVLSAKQSLATAEDSLATLQARKNTLESGISVAEQQVIRAQLDLSRTTIEAPFDGVVESENLELGTVLQKGADVISLHDPSAIEVRCSLDMKQLQWIWSNQANTNQHFLNRSAINAVPVTLVYQIDGIDWQWNGELEALEGGGIDERTRLAPCRVRVTDAVAQGSNENLPANTRKPALLAGMFLKLIVHIQPQEFLIRLPATAVQPGGFVWAVREGKLEKIHLRIAHATDRFVLVYGNEEDGLHPNEQVVVSPLSSPMVGLPVTVREAL